MPWGTPQEQADFLRTEYSPLHPKYRLTIISYLFEKDITPFNTENFYEKLDELVTFIGAGLEELAKQVEAQAANPNMEKEDIATKLVTDKLGGAYL